MALQTRIFTECNPTHFLPSFLRCTYNKSITFLFKVAAFHTGHEYEGMEHKSVIIIVAKENNSKSKYSVMLHICMLKALIRPELLLYYLVGATVMVK